jgi:hypothetical protein
MDLLESMREVVDWIHVAYNRDRWRASVNPKCTAERLSAPRLHTLVLVKCDRRIRFARIFLSTLCNKTGLKTACYCSPVAWDIAVTAETVRNVYRVTVFTNQTYVLMRVWGWGYWNKYGRGFGELVTWSEPRQHSPYDWAMCRKPVVWFPVTRFLHLAQTSFGFHPASDLIEREDDSVLLNYVISVVLN